MSAPVPRPAEAERLGLEAHPEGGWFRRLYTSDRPIDTENGPRPSATAILFYLDEGEVAAWHRVSSDELWLWHGPGQLDVDLAGDGESPQPGTVQRLAAPGTHDSVVQLLVPAGVWQRSTPVPGTGGVLSSCIVSPGFSFDDWELDDAE